MDYLSPQIWWKTLHLLHPRICQCQFCNKSDTKEEQITGKLHKVEESRWEMATHNATTIPSEHSTPDQKQGSISPSFQLLKAPKGSFSILSLNRKRAKPAHWSNPMNEFRYFFLYNKADKPWVYKVSINPGLGTGFVWVGYPNEAQVCLHLLFTEKQRRNRL